LRCHLAYAGFTPLAKMIRYLRKNSHFFVLIHNIKQQNQIKMPRLNRMSKTQKTFLVTHLENNKFLLQPNKLKPSELEKVTNGWEKFASELTNWKKLKKM
jgi:hypothetical protein